MGVLEEGCCILNYILNRVDLRRLTQEGAAIQQRPEVGERQGLHVSRGRGLQTEETKGRCKCPREEYVWCVQGTARR